MKTYLSIIVMFVLFSAHADAQNRYFTRTGKVYFLSDAPLEKIDAKNSQATSVFDATSGQFEFAILMKAFEFEKALMMEHFHENYVESDKYPKAVFKGVISNIAKVDCTKDGVYPVMYKGTLMMHGVTKEMEGKGVFTVKDGKIVAHSDFVILLSDYKIEIPSLVKEKVSNEVKIVVDANYAKM
ncbi:MAG: YceI family protein [Bacteroidetes bacterium]|nr:YceI family protein [Bacteroidota bacterium]